MRECENIFVEVEKNVVRFKVFVFCNDDYYFFYIELLFSFLIMMFILLLFGVYILRGEFEL